MDEMSRLSQDIIACDEINPLEDNDLVKVIHKYNIIYKHIFNKVFFFLILVSVRVFTDITKLFSRQQYS